MRKLTRISILAAIGATTLALGACNHVSEIGTIGDRTYHVVRSTDVSGPNIGMLVQVNNETGEIKNLQSFGADGVLNSAVRAAGDVAAADVYEGDRNTVELNRQYLTPARP